MTIGNLCISYDKGSSWAQWEKAGWSVRVGSRLLSIFLIDYRDGNRWPKWARFCLVLRKTQEA